MWCRMRLFDLNNWALVLALLCLLYVLLATFWNHLFYRDVLRHGVREEIGYRIGRAVHWRLPREGAYLMLGLSLFAVAAVVILPGWATPWLLGLESVVVAAIWLVAPPGQRMLVSLAGTEERGGAPLHFERKPLRALAVFILFGLLPAVLLGFGANILFR